MTATLPATSNPPAAPRVALRPASHRGKARGRGTLSTPSALRALLAALVALSLAWGGFGGWVAAQHSSAADSLATTDERLSLSARQMYQSIADADATITAAFLASSQPSLTPLERYNLDLATATGDLSRLQAAVGGQTGGGGQAAGSALAALSSGLPAYSGFVAEAKAEYAMGFPLTGGSFLQVASEKAHLVLLPAANSVYTGENAALDASSGQATEPWTVTAAVVLALITAFALYRAQRWLARRTNRVFSPGLVIASLLLVISAAWLAAGFLSARSDLDDGIAHGSAPVRNLALASIGVQQIRGDSVLNVISRSGGTSFPADFAKTSREIGPEPAPGWATRPRSSPAGRAPPSWRPPNGTRPPGTRPTTGFTSSAPGPTTPASGTWSSAPPRATRSRATTPSKATSPRRSPPTRPSSTPPPPKERMPSTPWQAS